MSIFGIIVEGPRDAAVYPAIIQKIRPEVEVVTRPYGGVFNLESKFVGWLKYFKYQHQVDKALVIRDSDGKDAHKPEAELRRPNEPVRF